MNNFKAGQIVTGRDVLQALAVGRVLQRRIGKRLYFKYDKELQAYDHAQKNWEVVRLEFNAIANREYVVHDDVPKFAVGDYIASEDYEIPDRVGKILTEADDEFIKVRSAEGVISYRCIRNSYRHATEVEIAYFKALEALVEERENDD